MITTKRIFGSVVILAIVLVVGGLIMSGFGRFGGQQLGHGYKLWRESESGLFYVLRGWRDRSGGGVFEGTITSIGVTNQKVVCYVRRLASIDKDGWYSLDLRSGKLTGPAEPADSPIIFGIDTNSCVAPDQFRN